MAVVATSSSYLTEHIKRFGKYVIDLETIPPPLQPVLRIYAWNGHSSASGVVEAKFWGIVVGKRSQRVV